MIRTCLNCRAVLKHRYKIKFCSNKCQHELQHALFIVAWKNRSINGNVGIASRVISKHIQRYMIETYGEKCSVCAWNQRHAITGRVPLEIDHIDGNAENNLEANLRLLCPNCHSLTPYFRNLNRGRGRTWRIRRLKNQN